MSCLWGWESLHVFINSLGFLTFELPIRVVSLSQVVFFLLERIGVTFQIPAVGFMLQIPSPSFWLVFSSYVKDVNEL